MDPMEACSGLGGLKMEAAGCGAAEESCSSPSGVSSGAVLTDFAPGAQLKDEWGCAAPLHAAAAAAVAAAAAAHPDWHYSCGREAGPGRNGSCSSISSGGSWQEQQQQQQAACGGQRASALGPTGRRRQPAHEPCAAAAAAAPRAAGVRSSDMAATAAAAAATTATATASPCSTSDLPPPPPPPPTCASPAPVGAVGLADGSWLDGLPLPDLFAETDPLSLFSGHEAEPDALFPLLPSLGTAGVGPAGCPSGAGGLLSLDMLCGLGLGEPTMPPTAAAAAAAGALSQGPGPHQQQQGQQEPGSPGSSSAPADEAQAEPAAGAASGGRRAQRGGQGAAAKPKGARRGRPRLYDTDPSAPAALATPANEEPPAKRGRGPKPKYVFGSREEAAGARRERNRKAALDSYYKQRQHVKELEDERDRLLAENASLLGLLGHMQAGGACPLPEPSEAGIDAWLGGSVAGA